MLHLKDMEPYFFHFVIVCFKEMCLWTMFFGNKHSLIFIFILINCSLDLVLVPHSFHFFGKIISTIPYLNYQYFEDKC